MMVEPDTNNPFPAQHFVTQSDREDYGSFRDYYGVEHHGFATTHIDALCHVYDRNGMWGGRDPHKALVEGRLRWGDIGHWSRGIVTRCVLLDIPRLRGTSFVEIGEPVQDSELEEACRLQRVEVRPGDAVAVCCGRESWEAARGRWGAGRASHARAADRVERPGLDASCLRFLRTSECSTLVWDMMDAVPSRSGVPLGVHLGIAAYGIAIIDNAVLEPLAAACAQRGSWEVMLVVAPLRFDGGTGSPVNPLALL